MNYIEYIEETMQWVCPKAGLWKVICVGGGASGGKSGESFEQNSGKDTGFGDYLTAKGAEKFAEESAKKIQYSVIGGTGGYTGMCYGGAGACYLAGGGSASAMSFSPATGNGGPPGQTGLGYGAGGGSFGAGSGNYGTTGNCGELKINIVELSERQQVSCTVGKGGEGGTTTTSGNDGVIILQYLGSGVI